MSAPVRAATGIPENKHQLRHPTVVSYLYTTTKKQSGTLPTPTHISKTRKAGENGLMPIDNAAGGINDR
jgi:hypothetical protein